MPASTTSDASIWDSQNLALTVGSILAVTIAAFQGLAVGTITPVLTRDLQGEHLYGWVFNAFLIPQIVGTVLGGREVDRRPPWLVFYPSMAIFAAGLILCAMATSMETMLAGRALAGFACGAVFSTVYAIISASYADNLRPAMLAAISSAWIIPSLIGPFIAGFITDHLHWRWVFLGLVPLLLVICALTWKTYRAVTIARAEGHPDVTHRKLILAAVLALGTLFFLLGPDLTNVGRLIVPDLQQTPRWLGIAMTIGGLAIVLPTLVRLLPSGTFTLTPVLGTAIATRATTFGAFAIAETFTVFALKNVGGLSSSRAGLILTVGSLSWSVGSIWQARWDSARGPESRSARMVIGALMMTAGIASLVADLALTDYIHWPLTATAWVMMGTGIGLAYTTSTAVTLGSAPTGREGDISSSMLLADLFSNAIGVGAAGYLLAQTANADWTTAASSAVCIVISLGFMVIGLLAAGRSRLAPTVA